MRASSTRPPWRCRSSCATASSNEVRSGILDCGQEAVSNGDRCPDDLRPECLSRSLIQVRLSCRSPIGRSSVTVDSGCSGHRRREDVGFDSVAARSMPCRTMARRTVAADTPTWSAGSAMDHRPVRGSEQLRVVKNSVAATAGSHASSILDLLFRRRTTTSLQPGTKGGRSARTWRRTGACFLPWT